MSKIITFSRKFPKDHISAGKSTQFVEMILNYLHISYDNNQYTDLLIELNKNKLEDGRLIIEDLDKFQDSLNPLKRDIVKRHTIRGSLRFKEGEQFTPAVWAYIPYRGSQIVFCPNLEVKKTFGFNINPDKSGSNCPYINSREIIEQNELIKIAENDGLSLADFIDWFSIGVKIGDKKTAPSLYGQVICWDKNVIYHP